MGKRPTEYLQLVDDKLREVNMLFEENDKHKTLLVVCTDDTEDGRTAMVAGLRGSHGNILQSLLHLMKDDEYYPLFREAMAIHEFGKMKTKIPQDFQNKQEKE